MSLFITASCILGEQSSPQLSSEQFKRKRKIDCSPYTCTKPCSKFIQGPCLTLSLYLLNFREVVFQMLRTDTRLELQETEVTYQVSVVTVSKAHCIQACKGSYSHTAGCTRNANQKLQTPKRITYKKRQHGSWYFG